MNKFFEKFQKNGSPNQLNKGNIYQSKAYISTDPIIINEYNINNDFSLSKNISMNNEKSNYIYLTYNENLSQQIQNQYTLKENDNFKIKIDKIKNNKKTSFDSSKENKNNKNIKNQEELNKKEGNKNRSIIDACSEIKKFKTELCHSWELTGTCKYGQNVIIFLFKNHFFIVCICSWNY